MSEFFRPFGAFPFQLRFPTACAVGCILSPLRGSDLRGEALRPLGAENEESFGL